MSMPSLVTAKCPECGHRGSMVVRAPGRVGCLECKHDFEWHEPDHQNQRGGGASDTTTEGAGRQGSPSENAPESAAPANFWALVEIMGRQQIVGKVSEQVIAGTAFLRVDVPATKEDPAFTRFYGGSSIYCISPVAEGVARKMLEQSRFRNKPVDVYDLPQIEDAVRGREEESVM